MVPAASACTSCATRHRSSVAARHRAICVIGTTAGIATSGTNGVSAMSAIVIATTDEAMDMATATVMAGDMVATEQEIGP
ncbi:hypothetical protein SDC9_193099 [bioreactor metagenome]|uniref:Uncharacterized protein n=1 Tax=bioreactor metagenome TaxID=1076179 RepID=A0A645I435_9ZZZZ